MKKKRFTDISTCICQECGSKMTVPREHGNLRKKGHIKDMWCPHCKKETKFLEIRDGDWYYNDDGTIIY